MFKKINLIFICFSLALSLSIAQNSKMEILSETPSEIIIKVSIDGFSKKSIQTPNGDAYTIHLEDGTPILEKGTPDLPKLTSSLIIDPGTPASIEVVSSSYTDYENMEVAPSKGNLYRNVDPATVPFEYGVTYELDAFYPSTLANTRQQFVFRDFTGKTIIANPIQYNPSSKILRVHHELLISMKPVSGTFNLQNAHTPKTGKIIESFDHLYKKRFLNYQTSGIEYDPVYDLGNMLIVCHDDYLTAIEPLATWKREKGIPTEVVAFSEIGSNEDDLYDYVRDYYNDNGLAFLLLIGDENTIPTTMVNYGGSYSCDNCFSFMEGSDHYPELFVGRFNAEDLDQVQTMVDRNMTYEKTPDLDNPNWFNTSLGLASQEGSGIGDDDEADYEHQNNIKTQLLNYTFESVYEFYDGSHGDVSPTPGDVTSDANGSANASMISDVLNTNGASLMNYTGHGWEQGVASGSFDVNAVYGLTNTGYYPFFIVVACCTGDFTDNTGGDCLGESWIRATDNTTGAPTGGIGGLFASIYQSWAPPMEGQDEMMNLITEATTYDIRHTIGGIAINGFASMNDAYGAGGDEMTDTWNIFGDPSVVLWTKVPEDMVVSHNPSVSLNAENFTVNCNIEGAMISLSQNGEILGTGMIANGQVIIETDPISSTDEIRVTATAFNHLPYQGPVTVFASGPYVVLDAYNIDDQAGNNNQLLDYSETVNLDVNLANIGLQEALGVSATLSSNDPNVTILDDTDDWGTIEEGNTQLNTAAFQISVADDISDQYILPFSIEVIDQDGNAFNSTFNIVVNAPELMIQEFSIDDQSGGNGNGRLEDGETAVLTIQNVNIGHSNTVIANGALTTTSPYLTISDPVYEVGILTDDATIINAIYTLEVTNDVPLISVAELNYELSAGSYAAQKELNPIINLIVEDFEPENQEDFEWEGGATTPPWFTTDQVAYEGANSSQSGSIKNNETTVLKLKLEILEDGTIGFYRKVSCEESFDFLRFFIDGFEQDSWSGEQDWEKVEYNIEAGEHEFVWMYQKDEVFSQGEDAAWIDFVTLPPYLVEPITSTTDLLQKSDLLLFPNPTNDQVFLNYSLANESVISISLLNAFGKQISELKTSEKTPAGEHSVKLSLQHLPSGIYLLNFQQDGHHITKKVIKL